jgi:DNA-directed RNA polymerase subunit K/omega
MSYTKYEKTRIIGVRATQIASGAPPTVDIGELDDAIDIATKEFEENKIPLILQRTLPNDKVIEIHLFKK